MDLQLPVQSVPITTNVVNLNTRSWRDVLDTTLCDKVCQWLATGRCFFPGTPVSSTNKTDRHDITEILIKVALDTINQAIDQTYTFLFQTLYNTQYIGVAIGYKGKRTLVPWFATRLPTVIDQSSSNQHSTLTY